MDGDGDGHGAGDPLYGCEVPEGFVATDDDCDDSDALRSPSLTEARNGYDDDRDDAIDEGVMTTFFIDADGDGWGARGLLRLRALAGLSHHQQRLR